MAKYTIDDDGIDEFKDQILIVLADYQTCRGDDHGFSRAEGIRIEVAKRIIDNLKCCAKPAKR